MAVSRSNPKQLPPLRPVGGARSPLLERRAPQNITGLTRLPGDEFESSAKSSPRAINADRQMDEYRSLSIGSPIPTLASDLEPHSPDRDPGGDRFPFITIQSFEEGSSSPGSASPDTPGGPLHERRSCPAARIDVSARPTDNPPGIPGPNGSGNDSPRGPPSPLLAPATPPIQRSTGEKQYMLYGKDGEQTVRSFSRDNLLPGDIVGDDVTAAMSAVRLEPIGGTDP